MYMYILILIYNMCVYIYIYNINCLLNYLAGVLDWSQTQKLLANHEASWSHHMQRLLSEVFENSRIRTRTPTLKRWRHFWSMRPSYLSSFSIHTCKRYSKNSQAWILRNSSKKPNIVPPFHCHFPFDSPKETSTWPCGSTIIVHDRPARIC